MFSYTKSLLMLCEFSVYWIFTLIEINLLGIFKLNTFLVYMTWLWLLPLSLTHLLTQELTLRLVCHHCSELWQGTALKILAILFCTNAIKKVSLTATWHLCSSIFNRDFFSDICGPIFPYLILVIFLHRQNFWRITFTHKNA